MFYQISARPLYTINREHYIGEIISLCRGNNVFADLDDLAPPVSVEAVLARDPEVLISPDHDADPFADWSRWETLAANRAGNRFVIPVDLIARPATRLVDAATAVCAALDKARARRSRA